MKESWLADRLINEHLKSNAQGAATTVYAAISKDWEGKGGLYLENCAESGPVQEPRTLLSLGYAPHAFDEEKEKNLWLDSLKMVGL